MSDALDRLFNAPKLAASAAPVTPAKSETPPPIASPTPPQTGLQNLSADLLTDFPDQPFKPYSGEKLEVLRESIQKNGIIEPLIVRPFGSDFHRPDLIGDSGRYQIISGHNRRRAGRLVGYTEFPCIVRELSDDEATLQMVETNLRRRDDLLPSEKAKAYRLRMEVLTHQGERTDLTGGHDVPKSRDEIGAAVSISGRQVQNYIRLAYLIAPLLDLVDSGKLIMNAGIALAFLSTESQSIVHQFFYLDHGHAIDQHLAEQLRLAEADGPLTDQLLLPFLSPSVQKSFRKVSVAMKPIRKFFKEDATPKEVEKTIVAALTAYFKEELRENTKV